ncbi:MAG: hypothetical protein IJ308_03580 [Clostridia bacterium]|nr:hypothetical protein [Clostridia bacterium]
MEQKRQETIKALQTLESQAKKNQAEGIPLVALHTECALKLAQDALAVLTAEPTSSAPVGKINTNKYALCTLIGDGKTDDGKEFELCVQISHAPFVRYGNKTFNLSWNDVVTLAERAGLFNDEVTE